MVPHWLEKRLDTVYGRSPVIELATDERIVVFSDLHMGSRGRNDDFGRNGAFFRRLIESHYLPKGWGLVLNGDVEELLRHPMKGIVNQWGDVYRAFGRFADLGRFHKIAGNHDPRDLQEDMGYPILDGLRVKAGGGEIFLCHGHQGGQINAGRYNLVQAALLRAFANTFGIKNFSPAYHSMTRYILEERLYRYASTRGVAMAIGHTHRPLFETRSKTSAYAAQLERLCFKWIEANPEDRPNIESRISFMRSNYRAHIQSAARDLPSNLYNREILVPSLFNSGCCIGKRGITALEIGQEKMRLVHWADPSIHLPSKVQFEFLSSREVLGGLHRTVIRKEKTETIMARIRLLAGALS